MSYSTSISDIPLSRSNVQAIKDYINQGLSEAKAELAQTVADMPAVKAADTDLRLECLKLAAEALKPNGMSSLGTVPISTIIAGAADLYAFARAQPVIEEGEAA